MARRPRATAATIGDNAIKPEIVGAFANRIEALLGELATEKGGYMQACRAIREDINIVYGEAQDAGIPKREFRAVIKARGLEKKLEACRAGDVETYDQIHQALGWLADTPLGRSALDKAPQPAV